MRLNTSAEEPLSRAKSEKYIANPRKNLNHTQNSDTHKMKPNIFKLLKQMNKAIKESADIILVPSKETFFHYYREEWNNNSIQEKLLECRKC